MKKVLLNLTSTDTSMLFKELEISTEKKTKEIAERLYDVSKVGDVFALIGDVGIGKTTLARYFIRKGGKEKIITSPSYNIFFKYETKKSDVYHLDAWRLEKDSEVLNLGITNFFYESIFIIEWAEKIEKFLPENRLKINFRFNKEKRYVSFTGNISWKERLKVISNEN